MEQELDKVLSIDQNLLNYTMIIRFSTKKSLYSDKCGKRVLNITVKSKDGGLLTFVPEPGHIVVGTDEIQHVTIVAQTICDPLKLINQPIEIS